MTQAVHEIAPIFDSSSTILILGSFPSVKSREGCFFYHHPQNRFWKVLSKIFESAVPVSIDEKRAFLLSHHIALWDVVASCEINASSDSSIRNVVPNEISLILRATKISHIYTNGGTASQLYNRYIYPATGIQAIKLPSTSPANAGFSLDMLVSSWQAILD